MKQHRKTLGIAALAFACLCITTAQATPTDRIIIKVSETMRPAVLADGAPAPRARERVSSLSVAAGHEVIYLRAMSGGADVVRLPEAMPVEQVQAMAAAMAQLPGVEYAEPDRRVFAATLPNDPDFSAQWNLEAVSRTAPLNYGIDALGAWEISTGEPVTVAVLDTGILDHLDLAEKVLPGYDFVDRDSDPSDPGDFVTEGEASDSCPETNSSWHGIHVSGTITAATNNGFGVAGISWGARILPVRVLGKCGGFVSDIVDAMRWSAGLPVSGVPANPHPSRILNLSLGGEGDCIGPGFASLRDAIRDVNAAGAVVIVAAGNGEEDLAVLPYAPAVCDGVVTVAATDRQGRRAGYSGFGEAVRLSAPGGGGGNAILSTLDGGETTPLQDDAIGARIGTSMATAHVSGVAALVLGYDPGLNRDEVVYLLASHTTAFPVSSDCAVEGGCGSGIVNAARALEATVGFTGLPPVSSGGGGGAFSVAWLLGFYLFAVAFIHNRRLAQPAPATAP
ncbi:MAG: S8 family serine peptidase [Thioalkalivibrio sp.]